MNKKGFATSTILYSLLALFLVSMSILILTLNNSASLTKSLNENTIQNIEYGAQDTNDIELQISELQKQIEDLKQNVINEIYPVGSIYISTTDDTIEKVQNRFGGKWEKYSEGTTLVGVGSYTTSDGNVVTYSNENKGGNNVVTLTKSNLPSHRHTYTPAGSISSTFTGTSVNTSSNGSHTHKLSENAMSWAKNPNGSNHYSYTGWSNHDRQYSDGVSATTPAGEHNHTVTAEGTVKSTFKGTASNTEYTGSGTSFNVQNPYTAVYMYKRVE